MKLHSDGFRQRIGEPFSLGRYGFQSLIYRLCLAVFFINASVGWQLITSLLFAAGVTATFAGIWGTRTDTENSLQNIKRASRRAALDDRLKIDRVGDVIYEKKMPSAFHETPLQSLLVWHQVDTVVITGGSTSGCVRATAVDSLSRGYRTIVPEECVADKHEIPHFASLADLLLKYADVVPVADVLEYLSQIRGSDA